MSEHLMHRLTQDADGRRIICAEEPRQIHRAGHIAHRVASLEIGITEAARYALIEHAHRLQCPQRRPLERYPGPGLRQCRSYLRNLAVDPRPPERHAERHATHAGTYDQHVFRRVHCHAPPLGKFKSLFPVIISLVISSKTRTEIESEG